ncbi:hypothetical protein KL86DYS1_20135 [uncultured Dysgonomonas sp.]|uniref:Uncharacterized protein n=1 Tax=uncultured Dysgonomonas sp. TaxID=206096 RepID=A0A212JLD1_9BACT|nr:hypothetical protein KL86DYS1_20135 [uncultured Dysgonomonas sp.]
MNNLYPVSCLLVSHITFNLVLKTYYLLKGNKGYTYISKQSTFSSQQ